ncbi:hypothetical protein H9623_17225 [Oerskovia sp. Sa1BUA8]|uniref:Uncharacterized protein n=1 Tax=Oerskovia douganii TaxID=2762210 RepID=A0A9D5Z0I6_9CELL|nr:hypothetical protein [Oerskovia douganii]MBE7702037.1 hypothetical protein [Oerskovia douganii]
MWSLDQLAQTWSRSQGCAVRATSFGLVIDTWEGERSSVELHLDQGSLDRYADSLDVDDLHVVWPGRTREWLASALVWTQLEEALASTPHPQRLELTEGRIVTGRP